jgi:HAE1 family hydrophobic/amphiphilic exporter-1
VDSAIVMTEAIHTGRNAGKDVETAVREAIREFRYPLISGTLTTVFAFVPMLLTSGIIGEFIKSIPVTITIVLMSSLFIALAILTTLSLRVFDKETSEEKNKLQSYIHHRIERIRRMYERTLHILLHGTKLRRMFFGALVVMLVGSFALVPTGILPVNMFPPDDQSSFFIDLRYPIGTPLSQTDEGIRQLEERVKQDTRVDMVSTNVGSLSNSGSAVDIGGPGDTHLAHLIVNLQDDRDESSEELVEAYQQTLAGSIPGATISVKQLSSGPGDAAPVEIRISGDDLSTLDQLAEQFRDFLETVPGTQNVDVSVKPTNGEFVFAINRAAANRYGVTAQDVAFTLRGAIAGSDATVLRSGGDDIDVAVQYAFGRGYDPDTLAPGSISIDQLNALLIQTPRGDIPLSQLGTISLAPNRSVVSHFDTERVIRVTSYTKPGVTPQAIFAQAAEHLETMTLPAGYSVVMGGENEDINKSFQDMAKAFVLAVFLIAGLLVLQFNSFKQPIYILVSIPLSLIGVLPGLVLVNLPLSFPGIIGIVALAGIVVNNAIILIDKININRQEGLSVVDAVEEAAISRFQPIVLTTITTIAGLLPLAISDPVWGPVAYSVIFGLSFSTILTLLVIPLLYRGFEREA